MDRAPTGRTPSHIPFGLCLSEGGEGNDPASTQSFTALQGGSLEQTGAGRSDRMPPVARWSLPRQSAESTVGGLANGADPVVGNQLRLLGEEGVIPPRRPSIAARRKIKNFIADFLRIQDPVLRRAYAVDMLRRGGYRAAAMQSLLYILNVGGGGNEVGVASDAASAGDVTEATDSADAWSYASDIAEGTEGSHAGDVAEADEEAPSRPEGMYTISDVATQDEILVDS